MSGLLAQDVANLVKRRRDFQQRCRVDLLQLQCAQFALLALLLGSGSVHYLRRHCLRLFLPRGAASGEFLLGASALPVLRRALIHGRECALCHRASHCGCRFFGASIEKRFDRAHINQPSSTTALPFVPNQFRLNQSFLNHHVTGGSRNPIFVLQVAKRSPQNFVAIDVCCHVCKVAEVHTHLAGAPFRIFGAGFAQLAQVFEQLARFSAHLAQKFAFLMSSAGVQNNS
jgi:hypothetical protein